MKISKIFLPVVAGLLLLSACSTMVSPSDEPSALIGTIEPTETEQLESTPTMTVTPTKTVIPTKTATVTPTPFMGFQDARLVKAWNRGQETIFDFEVPGANSKFYGKVDGHAMVCEPDPEKSDHLLCVTDQYLFGKLYMEFNFFADEKMENLLYGGEFNTGLVAGNEPDDGLIWPKASFTASDIIWSPSWCPQRGQNLTCETEYRLYGDLCTTGHTCYDACGWYYSVDTIPADGGAFVFVESCLP